MIGSNQVCIANRKCPSSMTEMNHSEEQLDLLLAQATIEQTPLQQYGNKSAAEELVTGK